MPLQLTTIKDTIIAKGSLNAHTVKNFKKDITLLFKSKNEVNLNVDKITTIDNNGLLAIYKLIKDSNVRNLKFNMVGRKSSNIYASIGEFV